MEDQCLYCRLCMKEENLLDMDDSIRNCIENVFSIEINDGNLSRDICQSCKEFLTKVMEFKEKVSKVQKLLMKILRRRKVTDVESHDVTNNDKIIDLHVKESRSRKTPQICAFEDLTDSNVNSKSSNESFSKMIHINPDEVENLSEKKRPTWVWNPNVKRCCACHLEIPDSETYNEHVQTYLHAFRSYVVEKYGEHIFSTHMMGYKCTTCCKIFTKKKKMIRHTHDEHDTLTLRNTLKYNTLFPQSNKRNDDDSILLEVIDNELDTLDVSHLKHKLPSEKKTSKPDSFVPKNSKRIDEDENHSSGIKPVDKPAPNVLNPIDQTVFICKYCDFKSINRRSYSDHLRKHYNLTSSQGICSSCFAVCNSRTELLTHRKNVHPPTKTEEELKKKLCRLCNRAFISLEFDKHPCVALKYPCLKKCGKRFETFSIMQRHSSKCNSGLTIYTCERCQKSRKTLQSLKDHMTKCMFKILPQPSIESKISNKVEKSSNHDKTAVSKKRKIGSAENSTDTIPEKQKSPTVSISIDNSKEKLRVLTWACKKCRMPFTELKHLTQHLLIAHPKKSKS